jgi:hypothetical protein
MTSLSDHERSNTILSAETGWAPMAAAESTLDRRKASVVGAAVAAAICLVIAAVGWLIAPEGWVLGIAGLPATTFFAWKLGPGVADADRSGAAARAFGLTVATILVSDALVVVLLIGAAAVGMAGFGLGVTATDALTIILAALGEGIFVYLIGAVVVGIPVSVVVFPAALVWAAIVRLVVRRVSPAR